MVYKGLSIAKIVAVLAHALICVLYNLMRPFPLISILSAMVSVIYKGGGRRDGGSEAGKVKEEGCKR
jgi:hypothetical protein